MICVAVSNCAGFDRCVMSPVWIMKAGRVLIALTRLMASSSVLVGSVFGSLLKPIWLSLICTKLNELVFSAACADEMRREEGTPPLTVQITPAPAQAMQESAVRRRLP